MSETIVSMQGICKSFPGVKALDNVHFEMRSGEVMALLGENGAGKSTLMKILSGVYTRDSGTMTIFGKECGDLTTKQAQALGVAIIHQELNMCPHLTVAENMFLGREKHKGFLVDTKAMEDEAKAILSDLKIDISPNEIVGNLPVSKQQMVEIAKALSSRRGAGCHRYLHGAQHQGRRAADRAGEQRCLRRLPGHCGGCQRPRRHLLRPE